MPYLLLVIADHTFRMTETAPLGRDHRHLMAHAQFARDDAHDVDIAAVGIDDHHLPQPGFGNLRTNRRPDGDEQLGTERQRAGAVDVFVGLADLLCRKHQDIQILRPLPLQLRQHAGRDGDIRCDRQMRAVLFRRGDRQNGNRGLGGEAGKIVCIELVPVKRRSHAVFPFRHLLR